MSDKPNIMLRKARDNDRDDVIWVESLSTPNLSYIPHVWDMFLNDEEGDWSVEELNGKIMACGKYSILPDESAWLETLRVVPQAQGLGLGKRLYKHWFSISEENLVNTMRMYTGVRNEVSAGLAKKFGFSLAETFHGTKMAASPFEVESTFKKITEVEETKKVLLPLGAKWGGWLVLNRTYYKWSLALSDWLTENGMVYRDQSGNVVIMGARFMKKYQLHIGLFEGDSKVCLDFAKSEAAKRGVKSLHCLYPYHCTHVEAALTCNGFEIEPSPFIVMEINL